MSGSIYSLTASTLSTSITTRETERLHTRLHNELQVHTHWVTCQTSRPFYPLCQIFFSLKIITFTTLISQLPSMKRLHSIILFAAIAISSCRQQPVKSNVTIDATYLNTRLIYLSQKMEGHLDQYPPDSLKIPRAIDNDGTLIAKGSRQWTSGFFPGTLWQLAAHTKSQKIMSHARSWSSYVEKEKWDTHTHEEITGDSIYYNIAKQHAMTTLNNHFRVAELSTLPID